MLRGAFYVFAALVLAMLVWLSAPTSLVFQPVAITYDRTTNVLTLKELVKWPGPIWLNFSHLIRMVNSDTICGSNGFRLLDPQSPNNVGDSSKANFSESWEASAKLRRCLDQPDFVATFSWSALIFGVLPMRPATLTLSSDAISPPPIIIGDPKAITEQLLSKPMP